jgi:pentatricopeptide repeat protein
MLLFLKSDTTQGLLHPPVKQDYTLQDHTQTKQTKQSKPQKKWIPYYKDPYHLSQKVKSYINNPKHTSDAISLVTRNKCATPESYGTLLTVLLKNKQAKEAIDLYALMLDRRIRVTSRIVTLVLKAYALYAARSTTKHTTNSTISTNNTNTNNANNVDRIKILNDAKEIYLSNNTSTSETDSTFHFNAMLLVCKSCVDVGGWEFAISEYTRNTRGIGNVVLDTVSYTILLQICALNTCIDGYNAALDVWNAFLRVGDHGKQNMHTVRMDVDEQLVCALLLSCIRVKEYEKAMFGVGIVQEYFGLPLDTTTTTIGHVKNTNKELLPISSKSLDVLLRLAARLHKTDLALHWFKIASLKYKIGLDDILKETLANVCIQANMYHDAMHVATSTTTDTDKGKEDGKRIEASKHSLMLKILASGADHIIKTKHKQKGLQSFIDPVLSLSKDIIENDTPLKLNGEAYYNLIHVLTLLSGKNQEKKVDILVRLACHATHKTMLFEKTKDMIESKILSTTSQKYDLREIEDLHWTAQATYWKYHDIRDVKFRVLAIQKMLDLFKENKEHIDTLDEQVRNRVRLVRMSANQVLSVWRFAEKETEKQKKKMEEFGEYLEKKHGKVSGTTSQNKV